LRADRADSPNTKVSANGAGEDPLGHHATSAVFQHVDAVIGKRIHDPAVRDDAENARPVLGDDEGPDKFVAHAADGFGDGDVGLDDANLFVSAGAQRGHFARNNRCYRHQTPHDISQDAAPDP
jgi:hypothetical protein